MKPSVTDVWMDFAYGATYLVIEPGAGSLPQVRYTTTVL